MLNEFDNLANISRKFKKVFVRLKITRTLNFSFSGESYNWNRNRICCQCDQMLQSKVAQFLLKVALK